MSLSDSFKPKTINDLIGHKKQIVKIVKWLKNWKKQKKKALLFHGPPGIGKTSSAHVISKELGYEIIETNASDKRSAGSIQNLFVTVTSRSLFNKKGKILIMDEVDGMSSGDRGGVVEIRKLIESSKIPIICIANDIVGQKLGPLRKVSEKIEFYPPSPDMIIRSIKKLLPHISNSKIENVVISSGGDIRNIFNTIQMNMKYCQKDQALDMDTVDAVKHLINEKKLTEEQKRALFYSDYQMMPLYIQQLYPSYIKNMKDLSEAADNMSLTDVINEKIVKNQQWDLLKYNEHLTVNTARKGGQFKGFMLFPQCLPKLSKTNKYKRILKKTNLDPDSLNVIYHTYLKKFVKGNFTIEEIETISNMFNKEDIYDLLEHFYGEKVVTANKRKITEIYKKREIIIGTITEKAKSKSKRKKKIQIKINE